MKHLINNLLLIALVLFLSTTVVSAQQMMNHSIKDSTKQMQHHMMMDSTKMHSTKKDSIKMMDRKMIKMDASKQTMKTDGKIWNTYCPVRGEEVDPDAPTVQYRGKTIGFCCPGCDDKFKANPKKYMKNLSKDGKKFIGKK